MPTKTAEGSSIPYLAKLGSAAPSALSRACKHKAGAGCTPSLQLAGFPAGNWPALLGTRAVLRLVVPVRRPPELTDTKRMASSDRKLVARIVIGQNPAWSFATGQPSKLAKSGQDVDETGSTRKAGRGRARPNTAEPSNGFVMGARFGFERRSPPMGPIPLLLQRHCRKDRC